MASIANFSDSNNECYEAQLAKRHAKTEVLLSEQEEKERLEHQARKEAKITEWKRLEEETQRKQKKEEAQQREEECQRNLAHCLVADRVVTMKQQQRKNWMKTFLLPLSFPSDKEINLLNFLPLTKRQRV